MQKIEYAWVVHGVDRFPTGHIYGYPVLASGEVAVEQHGHAHDTITAVHAAVTDAIGKGAIDWHVDESFEIGFYNHTTQIPTPVKTHFNPLRNHYIADVSALFDQEAKASIYLNEMDFHSFEGMSIPELLTVPYEWLYHILRDMRKARNSKMRHYRETTILNLEKNVYRLLAVHHRNGTLPTGIHHD